MQLLQAIFLENVWIFNSNSTQITNRHNFHILSSIPINPNSYKKDFNTLFMDVKTHHEIIFPDEFPKVNVGVLLHDQKILITGHKNGYLIKWDLETGKHERLRECRSTIETISVSPHANILVGCNSGLLFSFSLSSPKEQSILQEADYSKFSRVWRSVWPTEENILCTSTYGGFYHYRKENALWKTVSLAGHSDSIFAVGSQNGKLIATGDYQGLITVWNLKRVHTNLLAGCRFMITW